MHRATLLTALLVTAAALSGCKGSQAPDAQGSAGASESADALGPDAKPGVTAGAARLVLPVVPGRPGVAYFRVANNTPGKITLAGVHVQGVGKAEMHRTSGGHMAPVATVDIAGGASIAFVPGGLHVMAFDIDPSLKAGGQSELTLTFADGDKISIPAKVEAMGADAGGMAGMNH
ncbi:copper chaperone PCu(A)C [Novosphingobium sp. 9U]|uniref:copper chaperone PCu(A)C n=1 Tax=Novosphingobium sp. 9U TaxID=2653158 RepID=UPI0013575789|nr:copper chaperone PCu(A)C [Novosphingobium sp. 9U]